jgi:hypothetical protein
VAVESAGTVYVADTFNCTIRKVTAVGTNWVVTTLAGLAGRSGSADGTGSEARFGLPWGVAVDRAGNVYVVDIVYAAIRKVTPSGEVTTLAGLAAIWGSADGSGSDARFRQPYGVATDSSANLYVADTGNHTIRKVTSVGTNWAVTTLAGMAGSSGSADGTGSDARFNVPYGVAVDSSGNVFVTDGANRTIRKVTPAGVVTTVAGLAGSQGSADGTGIDARFSEPLGVAVDRADNVYVADTSNHTIRKLTAVGTNWVVTTLAGDPSITNQFGDHLGGDADGTGIAARFRAPTGVTVDTRGNVYTAEQGNTIRKGYPAGHPPAMILSSGPGFGFNSGHFGFGFTGPEGQLAVVEGSMDLVNWLPLWTNTFAGALNFSDSQSGAFSNRFYRAHLP